MSEPEQQLWRLMTLLGAPVRQFMSQSGGSDLLHEVHWKCGCNAQGQPHRLAWTPCGDHAGPPDPAKAP